MGSRFQGLARWAWPVLILLPVAVWLRLYHLDHQNLWLDETLTWADSQLPTYWLLRRSALNVHPPGSFLFMKFWTSLFGSDPAVLRLPFALTSVALILLTGRLAMTRFSMGAAFLAAALMTVSPHQIYFAQEARMYTLAAALTLGGVICYSELLNRNMEGWPVRVGFVVLFAAALYTHYFSVFILATVHFHYLTRTCLTKPSPEMHVNRWPAWAGLNASVLALFIPWVLFVVLQPPSGRVGYDWRPMIAPAEGLGQIGDFIVQMTAGYFVYPHDVISAFDNYRKYPQATDARDFFYHRFTIFLVGLPVMIGIFVQGVRTVWHKGRLILALFAVPFFSVGVVMFVAQREMTLSRYLMVASPYFFIILAAGLHSIRVLPVRIGAVAVLIVAMGLALQSYYAAGSRGGDYRPVASYIEHRYRTGDVIVADPSFMDRSLQYYLSGSPLMWRAVINTDLADTTVNYLSSHASLLRVWLIIDFRSGLWSLSGSQLESQWPTYTVSGQASFPDQAPKIKVFCLEYIHAGHTSAVKTVD